MSLSNEFNGMTIKERSDINAYLIKRIDIKNQLKIFSEEIVDKTFINISFNRLP